MSKICFLILAHKNYNQTMRLINHLKKDFDLFVHIDKKSALKIDSFENVKVYKKFKVYYEDITMVIATLFLMEEAIKNNYDRYILISAQDMPLLSNKNIVKFFNDNKDNEYINFCNVKENKNTTLYNTTLYRLTKYHFRGCIRKLINNKILDFITGLKFLQRHIPDNLYSGSQWWNLTKNAVSYILNYIKENPNYKKIFNHTLVSDEYFFQTILLNSPIKTNIINNNHRYIIFDYFSSHPRTFTINDSENFIRGGINLFARKFDEKIDNDIIDKLYKKIEN